jgi:hypothetical protein
VDEGCEEGIEDIDGRQDDADAVDEKRPCEVLPDDGPTPPSNSHCLHQLQEIIAQQDDVCGLARNFSSRAHPDADAGLGQGRCVVDTVSDHRDNATGRLEALNFRVLLLWHQFGKNALEAKRGASLLGHGAHVASYEDEVEAHVLELAYRDDGLRPDDVGDLEAAEVRSTAT